MSEVQKAVEAARAVHGKFIFVPAGASPEVREALGQEAQASGRELLDGTVQRASDAWVAQHVAADLPTIDAADERAFLKNLKGIASGRVRVV